VDLSVCTGRAPQHGAERWRLRGPYCVDKPARARNAVRAGTQLTVLRALNHTAAHRHPAPSIAGIVTIAMNRRGGFVN